MVLSGFCHHLELIWSGKCRAEPLIRTYFATVGRRGVIPWGIKGGRKVSSHHGATTVRAIAKGLPKEVYKLVVRELGWAIIERPLHFARPLPHRSSIG